MTVILLLAVILALAVAAFLICRARAVSMSGGKAGVLHSLPGYYGWNGAIMVMLPAFAVLMLWLIVQPMVITARVADHLPPEMTVDDTALKLAMADVRRLADGIDVALERGMLTVDPSGALQPEGGVSLRESLAKAGVALAQDVAPDVLVSAQEYRSLASTGLLWRAVLVLLTSIAGFIFAVRSTRKEFRARNRVEGVVQGLLMAASTIAILTTIGIAWSMLSETFSFFAAYPITDFFFGLTWSPNFRGGSDLGFIPLLWGTLYISLISMLVAVPIGLFAAIYLAEYASPRTRAWVKPLIEVIAGIPTVVFGLFALVTVGPLLRDYFAQPLGFGNSGSSVMNAGIVIGILNIPFVSSLADDIINAVPQSLRDGSYGIGATKSETVKQVVLPAALPGIVGAILLAASRAIGETMIVAMGAGAAAKLDMNPFEAMTTMTVKIVGQLTGDTDFASPETLVAFALGMTLFVITLGLNVMALYVVRKYREQYE
jgi:phosphate transport system permease protein